MHLKDMKNTSQERKSMEGGFTRACLGEPEGNKDIEEGRGMRDHRKAYHARPLGAGLRIKVRSWYRSRRRAGGKGSWREEDRVPQ